MNNTDQLLQQLIDTISSDNEICAAILFGSHARGQATIDSDIDVCPVLDPHFIDTVEIARKN